jgi:hypothetical protein
VVFIGASGSFKKTGGTIYGVDIGAGPNANKGFYAILHGSSGNNRWRKTTAGEGVNLDTANAGNTGGWGE